MSEQVADRQTMRKECAICPRQCRIDRSVNSGYCGEGESVRVARASLHRWEEPCISGESGSGTVFFSGCPLKCVFCQNKKISVGGKGKILSVLQLSNLFLRLQESGAENINLVTPTHFTPQIVMALQKAKAEGLTIPVVYNTSGYEQVETLRLLEGLVDIYLPDLNIIAVSCQSDILRRRIILNMRHLQLRNGTSNRSPCFGNSKVPEKQIMRRGVIVRHMVLPGHTKDSQAVIQYLYHMYGERIYLSILNQYTPMPDLENYSELNRRVTKREYDKVIDYAIHLGVENAWIQEGSTAKESFVPDFDAVGDYL